MMMEKKKKHFCFFWSGVFVFVCFLLVIPQTHSFCPFFAHLSSPIASIVVRVCNEKQGFLAGATTRKDEQLFTW